MDLVKGDLSFAIDFFLMG